MGERIKEEELKKKNQEIAELSASLSEGEPEGAKMPFFLPRKHSVKNYYEDSDSCVCAKQFVSQSLFQTWIRLGECGADAASRLIDWRWDLRS